MDFFRPDPERFRVEQRCMHERTHARLYDVDGALTWVEHLQSTATGRPFAIAIKYPAAFPHSPPRAFVLSPPVDGAPHRLIDGSLCLWDNPAVGDGVRTTALMVRNRAVVWFLAFEVWKATGEWMAPQHGR